MKKLFVSTVFNQSDNMRCYVKVKFLKFEEQGLLDTGASISVIGGELANYDFSKFSNFQKIRTPVSTADGTVQQVLGTLNVDVCYKDQTKEINFYIIPSIKQRVILGIDFWKIFSLAPNIISSLEVNSEVKINDDDDECTYFELNDQEKQQLEVVKALFPNFAIQGLGRTTLISHDIDVGEAKPIKQRFYPVSPAVEELMYKEVDRMISLGVIEPSNSAWSSPMRLVLKPNKVRLCLDARRLNEVTTKDAYPLPTIEGIFSRLPQANIITKLDLKDAYWQIGLTEKSKPLTAFTIPGRPLYHFVVMPFGLCSAPQTMCRLMDSIIPPDLRFCVFGYLDDLCVVSADFSTHITVLVRLADEFKKANLTLNVAKSKFCVTSVKYLGFIIGNGGVSTDPEKIVAVNSWPTPKSVKQVKGFMGLAGFYRRFIHNFSDVMAPISSCTSTKKPFEWTAEAETAFNHVKTLLTTAPILANPDFKKKFYLQCDASDYGIGAVLVQIDDEGSERPIAYMSRKLNSAERNYSVTERECLAAVRAVVRFRCYLELYEFEIITDHASLVWLMRQPNLNGRLARWVFILQGYTFKVSHRKGKENIVPDLLSRSFPPEINEISLQEKITPEIDLNSSHFEDEDYKVLKTKILAQQENYPDIKIVDNFIYFRTEHYSGDKAQEIAAWKLWIPIKLRIKLIERAHDSKIAGHGGIAKTLELLRRNFYWPGMLHDVKLYISTCEICKSIKAPNITLKPPMGSEVKTFRPMQRLYIDILGPYPRSKNGHIGLLIILDHLTKFHWLFPLKKFTSAVIENILEKEIFHVFGVPEILLSDNGTQFKSNNFNAFLTQYGISHMYTAIYSPQSNASERVNRSVIAMIRIYIKSDQREWDKNLTAISCSLRNSIHQSLKITPYHALFGFDMATHGSTYKILKNLQLEDEPAYKISRDDQMALIRKNIRGNIAQSYQQNVRQYDLRTRPISFQVGQEIFRRNFSQSNAQKNFNSKLAPLFVKARIKEKLGNHYYVIEDMQRKLLGTYHAKDLRQ